MISLFDSTASNADTYTPRNLSQQTPANAIHPTPPPRPNTSRSMEVALYYKPLQTHRTTLRNMHVHVNVKSGGAEQYHSLENLLNPSRDRNPSEERLVASLKVGRRCQKWLRCRHLRVPYPRNPSEWRQVLKGDAAGHGGGFNTA